MMKLGAVKKSVDLSKDIQIEWWQSLKNSDKTILSKIYITYADKMFRYGMSIIADKDFIKDCIQDVFVDLWKYRENLSNTDNIKFYLFKSLRNKIYNLSAKEKKSSSLDKKKLQTVLTSSHEDMLIDDQRDKHIQQALANGLENLPQRQREVIRHLYFENHSYEETSEVMSINIRSVYTLAWKALSSLRKSLPSLYTVVLICSAWAA